MFNKIHSKKTKKKISKNTKKAMDNSKIKEKQRDARLGKIGNNKGKHWKVKDSSKMNKSKVGIKRLPFSKKWKKNMKKAHIGKKQSEKTRKKISDANKGEKSYCWKGGISLESKRIRHGIEFRLWREAVFARDNWTCQKTGIKGGILHPHHIQNFSDYPELRFAIDNGITISEKMHTGFHKKYGYKNNTIKQLEEFLNKK